MSKPPGQWQAEPPEEGDQRHCADSARHWHVDMRACGRRGPSAEPQARDPAQHANLYAERPDDVRRLKALLERYKAEGRSVPARP